MIGWKKKTSSRLLKFLTILFKKLNGEKYATRIVSRGRINILEGSFLHKLQKKFKFLLTTEIKLLVCNPNKFKAKVNNYIQHFSC